jgi:hypothetical protein
MHHCVGGYAPQCTRGDSIIVSMRKNGKGYVTIELKGEDLKLSQYYTLHDIVVTSKKALKIIEEWYKDVISLHTDDSVTYKTLVDDKIKRVKQIAEERRLQAIRELSESTDATIMAAISHGGSHATA